MGSTVRSSTTTGGVVTIYWSGMGDPGRRKFNWGVKAANSLGAVKLTGDTWEFDHSFVWADVLPILQEVLGASDRALVTFPHGSKSQGESSMSIHRVNC